MDKYVYYLVNRFTGSRYGRWDSKESAECYRNMLDDWINWDIDYELI